MSLKLKKQQVRTSPVYKMSLGKNARYREEALRAGALVFQSEKRLYDAVVEGAPEEVRRAAIAVKTAEYPKANAPENAWKVWVRTIGTFNELPNHSLILHWEADEDKLHWGIVGSDKFRLAREETNDFGQTGYIFHRALLDGWHTRSVNDVPLSNIPPAARSLAINMATLNLVQTDPDFFRALILDEDLSEWIERPEWQVAAKTKNWHPKPVRKLRTERRKLRVTQDVEEAAEFTIAESEAWAEISRMATTAVKTATYANGQTKLVTVKAKEIEFSREELEDEIAFLLKKQANRCALTHHKFRNPEQNPHLRMSLDRKDSSQGYIPGNLQVVTRAANFYKSASDEADWALKEEALFRMAVGIKRRRESNA